MTFAMTQARYVSRPAAAPTPPEPSAGSEFEDNAADEALDSAPDPRNDDQDHGDETRRARERSASRRRPNRSEDQVDLREDRNHDRDVDARQVESDHSQTPVADRAGPVAPPPPKMPEPKPNQPDRPQRSEPAAPVSAPAPADSAPEHDPAEEAEESAQPVEITHVSEGRRQGDEPPALRAGPRSPNRQRVPSPDELARKLAFHVCPFCGHKNESAKAPCTNCGMPDNGETRTATTRRVGPWFLLQPRNPGAPGMKFSVLRELVKGGQVNSASVVRGPTTQQLWTFAARVRGLAHLFGLCWNCNRRLPNPKPGERPDDFCIYCGALLEPPSNPDQQLEVAETSESLGVTGSGKASQVSGAALPPRPAQAPAPSRGIGRRRASVSDQVGKQLSAPGGARPVPSSVVDPDANPGPKPRRLTRIDDDSDPDGGDALLTTRELATAFNLDRRSSKIGGMSRFPWGRLLLGLVVLGLLVFAFVYASRVFWR